MAWNVVTNTSISWLIFRQRRIISSICQIESNVLIEYIYFMAISQGFHNSTLRERIMVNETNHVTNIQNVYDRTRP